MTAKIDWYREVLELEPNSKIFFPLAKLLAEEGKEDEAITLLEKGLARHPEYLEARLFRIELLYKNGKKEECNSEIEKLSKMFASYAGFWQAWAACLTSDNGQADAASLLRFLAAHFVSGPLRLHDVLNRGIDALIKDGAIKQDMPLSSAIPSALSQQTSESAGTTPEETFAENSQAMLADLDSMLEEAAEPDSQPEMIAAKINVISDEIPQTAIEEQDLLPATESAEIQAEALETADEAEIPLEDLEEKALPEPEEELLPATEPEAVQAEALESMAEAEIPLEDLEEKALPEPEELLPATEPETVQAEALESMAEAEIPLENLEEKALPEPEEELLPATEPEAVQEEILEESAGTLQAENLDSMEEAEIAATKSPTNVGSGAIKNAAQAEADMIEGLDLPGMDEPESAPIKPQGPALTAVQDEAEEEQEEQFSLRTRSMAEVLAEQGDIQGALDIYRELAAAATSADEAQDINHRIATLSSRLEMANASSGFKAAEAEAAAKSKEKLIGMLEALAKRVEERASS